MEKNNKQVGNNDSIYANTKKQNALIRKEENYAQTEGFLHYFQIYMLVTSVSFS